MKKIVSLTFAAVCLLGLASCEGEEENEFVTKNYVAGTWEITQIGALNNANILNYVTVTAPEGCSLDRFTFNEDMTFTETDFTINEGVCGNVATSGTYEIETGNVILSTVEEGETVTRIYDLLALTNVMMEVVYTDEETNKLVFVKFTKDVE